MSAYPYLDSQNISIKQDVSFPALGGVDLVTDKLSVNPGTLQDCLNYEVGTEPGYKQIDGLMRYSGRSYNVVNTPVCGDMDLNGTSLFLGGEYKISLGDSDNTAFIGEIKPIKLTSGSICYQILDGTHDALFSYEEPTDNRSYQLAIGISDSSLGTSFALQEFNSNTGDMVGSPNVLIARSEFPGPRTSGPDFTQDSSAVQTDKGLYLVTLAFNSGDSSTKVYCVSWDNDLNRTNLIDTFHGPDTQGAVLSTMDISKDSRYVIVGVNFNSSAWDSRVIVFDLEVGTYSEFISGDQLQDVTIDDSNNIYTAYRNNITFSTFDHWLSKYQLDGTHIWTVETNRWGMNTNSSGQDNSVNRLQYYEGSLYGINRNASHEDAILNKYSLDNGAIIWSHAAGRLGADYYMGLGFSEDGVINYGLRDASTGIRYMYWVSSTGSRILEVEAGIESQFMYGHDGNLYTREVTSFSDYLKKWEPNGNITFRNAGIASVMGFSNSMVYPLAYGRIYAPFDIRVYPNRENTSTYAIITNQAVPEYNSVDDFIAKYYDHNKGIATDSFKPPGSGPITSLFELDDMVYATRDNEAGDAGKLYKTTDLPDLSKDVEWEEIDLGLTLDFKNGRTNPLTIYDKEFLDVEVEPSSPVLNRLGSEAESVATLDLIGSSLNATTTTGAWANPEHVLEDGNDDVLSTAFRQHANINVWYQTQILRITGFDVGKDASKFVRVVGVKADINHGFKGTLMGADSMEFRMKSAHLTNVGGTDNKRDPTIRTQTTADGNMFYTSTLGGIADNWNAADPSTDNFFDENFGIDLVFEGRYTSGDITTSSQGNRFYVRWVKMSVYFEDGSERVYFWNGTSDVAEADMLDTQVESGDWSTDDAKGTFTLYNAVTPENIIPDLEIRSAPLGAGAYIADTDGVTQSGVFPTSTQINDHNAFVQTIKSNFYMDEEKEAIYGVSGAGPAFTFDGKYMRQIRAPVPKEKDKPRHIANHQDHLVLGFKSGSILVSVAGEPTLFDGVEGASEWGFGSRITGLLPLKGNALAVFTRDSTHAFIGNSLDNFTTQYISKTSGALEYSVVNMGQPIYCDNFGISNIGVTEQYGDFDWNKISRSISPWIQGAIQESSGFMYNYPRIVTALPIRHKNQYRLYFTDGTNMTMTMAPVPEGDFPMFTFHNYSEGNDFGERHFVPTAALSTVLSDGRELIMLGDKQGDIYVLEQGTGILTNSELIPYDSYLIFNPFNGDMPVQNIKYNQAFVHLKHSGQQELTLSAGVNYLQPVPTTFKDTVEGVTPLGGIHFDLVPDKIVAHLPSVTDGFSLKINSIGNGNLPHIVQAITYKVAPSSSKNAAPNRY